MRRFLILSSRLVVMATLTACTHKALPPLPDQTLKTSPDQLSEQSKETSLKNLKSYKMSNGLEVFLIEKRDIPMITIMIAVKNGSFAETESNNGLAHLYEHMFFKANEKYPSQPQFMKMLGELGIELGPNMNAYTSTESVRYFFTIQSQYVEQGIQFMADALLTPQFLQDELEKERQVVISEFDIHEASPSEVFYQHSLMQRLFPQHFIRKNVIGMRDIILSASHDQMKEIQKRYYIPNNSALFVVGDYNEAEIRRALEASLGSWKPGADPFIVYPVPEHPPLEESRKFIEQAQVQTVSIAKTFHGPRMTKEDEDLIALDLASIMLSFESSPFQKELVHSGLTNSASFSLWSQRWTSPIFVHIDTTTEEAQKAYETFEKVLARITAGGFFTERELQIAKDSVEVRTAYDREIGQNFALNLASIWTSTGSIHFYETYLDKMKAITLADIDRALATYLLDKPFVLGGLVPLDFTGLKFEGMEPIRKLTITAPTAKTAATPEGMPAQ